MYLKLFIMWLTVATPHPQHTHMYSVIAHIGYLNRMMFIVMLILSEFAICKTSKGLCIFVAETVTF